MPKLAPTIAVLLVLAVPARADGPPRAEPAASAPAGKPRAPVAIEADVADGAARVRLTFRSAATGVAVRVYGVNGLRVDSPEDALSGASVAAGETRELDVTFSAPAGGRSRLAVAVSGRFRGAEQSAAASFTVGAAPKARKAATDAGTAATPGGERLKKVPPPQR